MLIRLNPIPPDPSVFYTVSYPDTLGRVALPTGWALQLHALQSDEFEYPSTPHVLDKATWLTTVLVEVAFDLVTLTVVCSFIDGSVVRWPIVDYACVKALENILADVKQSTIEVDKERYSFEESRRPQSRSGSSSPESTSGKPPKHKRQRSILMSLVACVNKLVTTLSLDGAAHGPMPARTAHPLPRPSTSLPPVVFSQVPLDDASDSEEVYMPPSPSRGTLRRTPTLSPATFLRLRARSALVDICRKFVITELASKMAPGRYHAWIARSVLSHTEQQMLFLIQDAGGANTNLMNTSPPRGVASQDASFSMSSTPFFDDEESYTESTSTDTDGSSVHTPVESPTSPSFAYAPDRPYPRFPRSPSPPSFSAEDVATYTALSGQRLRLHALISRIDSMHASIAAEERSFYAVLEIKSRRRAWSNRAYLGGARASDARLATPLCSSPLARCRPVTPDNLYADADDDADTGLQVTSIDANIAKLFPVSEEDEEDALEGMCSVRLVSDVTLQEMESGLLPVPVPVPRPRTHSMLALHPLQVQVQVQVAVEREREAPRLTSAALLCQPFEMCEKTETLTEPSAEFTLAMDLPPPYAALQRFQCS